MWIYNDSHHPFVLTFNPWQANLERVMIEFADVMNKMVNDEKITHTERFRSMKSINRSRKSLKII